MNFSIYVILMLVVGTSAVANELSFTSFSTEGADNSSVLLAQHRPQCSGSAAITEFKLAREIRNGFATGRMRYEYKCSPVTALSASKPKYTDWNDEGGGNTVYLDRHHVACAPNQILNQFELVRRLKDNVPTGEFRYEYRCMDIGSQSLSPHETQFNDDGGGRNVYLDRHRVSCPSGSALNSFRLVRSANHTQYKYIYTCAKIPNQSTTPIAKNQEQYSRGVGLRNLTNTCFANSIHKLLMATTDLAYDGSANPTPVKKSFFAFFEKLKLHNQFLEHDPNPVFDSDGRFEAELTHFYKELAAVSPNVSVFYPSAIRVNQVDAQDYFLKLVELLDLHETLPGFRLANQTTLASGHKNAAYLEPGHSLSVSLPIFDEKTKSVSDAIGAYFEPSEFRFPNYVENDVTGVIEEGSRRQYLVLDSGKSAPRQIFVALNRFSPDGRKENKRIMLDQAITLDFHSRDLQTKTSKQYRLKAVSIHRGTLGSGHYTAYTMDAHGNWIFHDDSMVKPVSPNERAAAEEEMHGFGYMMLYEAI